MSQHLAKKQMHAVCRHNKSPFKKKVYNLIKGASLMLFFSFDLHFKHMTALKRLPETLLGFKKGPIVAKQPQLGTAGLLKRCAFK